MASVEKDAGGSLSLYDVILAGTEGVGKSSIFNRLRDNSFVEGSRASLGIDQFERKHLLPNGEAVKFRLWDTGGAERYDALTRSYYRNRHAVVLVFSVDQRMSTIKLKFYLENAIDFAPKDALFVFVCNKIDLAGDDSSAKLKSNEIKDFISLQKEELRRNHRSPPLFFETSAKTGEGINDALEKSLVAIHNRATSKRKGDTDTSQQPGYERQLGESVKLHEENNARGNGWCPSWC